MTGDIDKTQEFQKANMNLRVIRIDKNGLPKEDSPFKTYNFQELVSNDNWEESQPYQEICSKRFLFVIFKENSQGEFVLDGIKFWGFPDRLVDEVKRVWQETRKILDEQSRINKIVFTKIHASNSLYELEPGIFVGKGKESDTDILPDGRRITKHSFWFPKRFLKDVLSGEWE